MASPGDFKEKDEDENEKEKQEFTEKRLKHEFEMLRNPVTGTIPANIREIEQSVIRKIKDRSVAGAQYRTLNQNTYKSVGPTNIGGRSRGFDFDRRNPNIMVAGGTQGGIFRSTDGGANWTFVTPEDAIRSSTSIVQDPTQPDVWYCGTGEVFYPYSFNDVSNGTFGYGIFKSTNNGATWSKLTATEVGSEHSFDNRFDIVHRLAVHPVTGAVYAAVHSTIMRSTDGGNTWQTVLGAPTGTARRGITEIIITSSGNKIFAGFSGENSDRSLAGVWESSTGNPSEWTRIAGGPNTADSVAGWQPYGKWGRLVFALNNTNTQLFVLYKNAEDASGANPKPEADLFRANISSGNPSSYTWTNLSAWVPDEAGFNLAGVDPYTTQFFGYNMSIEVKPDNDNILFIGGTVLDRVDLTQTIQAQKFRRIGGYGIGFFPQPGNFIYPDHHPDVHRIKFLPGSSTIMFTASDGGIHKTLNAMADTVRWVPLVNGLQTVHFQHISTSPEIGDYSVMGGSQDNGTLVNENPRSSTEHFEIGGGDGASSAISNFTRNGNTWKQNYFVSTVEGTIYRVGFTFQFNPTTNQLTYVSNTYDNITPTGLSGEGQWLTLLLNDPDSSEFLFYNSKNKLFRTSSASTVGPTTWTEITGVGNTIPSSADLTIMAVSKSVNRSSKYLFVGTNTGKIYRLANPTTTTPSTTPVDITPSAMLSSSYVAGIAVNPRNPDTLLVVVSNYDAGGVVVPNIFLSTNATSANPTWQILDGALGPVSSQSCEIVVKTTGVEFYVGTSVGLYSTLAPNGNSTTWVREGSGMMKTAIIRSLKNRQRDNFFVVGTHGNGAFISEIGNAVNLDVVTAVDPVVNNKNFIVMAYPTITRNKVFFTTGNLNGIRKINVQVISINGQKILEKEADFRSGEVDLSSFASGSYLLIINSDNKKFRFVQKIIKQ